MTCKRCPHHVRHGKVGKDGKTIVFADLCGLKVKQKQDLEPLPKKGRGRGRPAAEPPPRKRPTQNVDEAPDCIHYPFSSHFDYFHCQVYIETFESKGLRNGVLPTKDFQYSEHIAGIAVTDMELL
ncbi:MAG: hypothetical protein H6618_04210 [Deltaproteobacteria bacterium]|nr:hypothetical protein [Deltaproteobacteria bacterium]